MKNQPLKLVGLGGGGPLVQWKLIKILIQIYGKLFKLNGNSDRKTTVFISLSFNRKPLLILSVRSVAADGTFPLMNRNEEKLFSHKFSISDIVDELQKKRKRKNYKIKYYRKERKIQRCNKSSNSFSFSVFPHLRFQQPNLQHFIFRVRN